MARHEESVDQIVFRWDADNTLGTTGFGPVAWSCERERAETIFGHIAPLLRTTAAETVPALVRLEGRGSGVLLIRRAVWPDPDGQPSTVCHALIGTSDTLDVETSLGLHHWRWEGGDLPLGDVRGDLAKVRVAALLAGAERGRRALMRGLADEEETLAAVAAELLRRPGQKLTVLDGRGGDSAFRVLWGLYGIFRGLPLARWTFATHDTAEARALRFVFVRRWPGPAPQRTEWTRTDPRERLGDRAEQVAAWLVDHYLRGAEEGEEREYEVARALASVARSRSPFDDGALLDMAAEALDRLAARPRRLYRPDGGSRPDLPRRGPVRPDPTRRDFERPDPPRGGPGPVRRDAERPDPRRGGSDAYGRDGESPDPSRGGSDAYGRSDAVRRDGESPDPPRGVPGPSRAGQDPPFRTVPGSPRAVPDPPRGGEDPSRTGSGPPGRDAERPEPPRAVPDSARGLPGRPDADVAPDLDADPDPDRRPGGARRNDPGHPESGGRESGGRGWPGAARPGGFRRDSDRPDPLPSGPGASSDPGPSSGPGVPSDPGTSSNQGVAGPPRRDPFRPGPKPPEASRQDAERPDPVRPTRRETGPVRPEPFGRDAQGGPPGPSGPYRPGPVRQDPPRPTAPVPTAPAAPPLLRRVQPDWPMESARGSLVPWRRRRTTVKAARLHAVLRAPEESGAAPGEIPENVRGAVRGGSDGDLIAAVREPGLPYVAVTALVKEIASRYGEWNEHRRQALCDAVLERGLFAAGLPWPPYGGRPSDETQAANAAALYLWAVRPLAREPRNSTRLVALLPRLGGGQDPVGRSAVRQILEAKDGAKLRDEVWLALLDAAWHGSEGRLPEPPPAAFPQVEPNPYEPEPEPESGPYEFRSHETPRSHEPTRARPPTRAEEPYDQARDQAYEQRPSVYEQPRSHEQPRSYEHQGREEGRATHEESFAPDETGKPAELHKSYEPGRPAHAVGPVHGPGPAPGHGSVTEPPAEPSAQVSARPAAPLPPPPSAPPSTSPAAPPGRAREPRVSATEDGRLVFMALSSILVLAIVALVVVLAR
ncbi:hypothetical protein [Streptomyces hebeiensis]